MDAQTGERVVARVVEVEAYLGLDDPASHAFRGPTPRAAIMFGEPGHLYVYLSYGVHFCANVVTEARGTAGAVLLRAAVVEVGLDVVRTRRGDGAVAELLRGPGNLCRGLALTRQDNGLDLCDPGSRMRIIPAVETPHISISARIGIREAAEAELRFTWTGHPAVSRRPGPNNSPA